MDEQRWKEIIEGLKLETAKAPWYIVKHEGKVTATQIIPRLMLAIELPFVGPFWTYLEAMQVLHKWVR